MSLKALTSSNKAYFDISGIHLDNLQNTFTGINVVIIDKVSIMGGERIDRIDKILRQASTSYGVPFGGFLSFQLSIFRSCHR